MASNLAWNLETFLDSLVYELDRARDRLAVKALNRPLSYSVKDLGLQLQIFPQYDGRRVRFVTAEPGQTGAAGLRIELGSITSRTIKETSAEPITKDDLAIEFLDIEEEAKDELRKLGIKSARDIARIEERDVDLEKFTNRKLDYGNLANVINSARRRERAPSIAKASVLRDADGAVLSLEGKNLVLEQTAEFPVALLEGEPLDIVSASPVDLRLRVPPERMAGRTSRLEVALDPFAVLSLELKA
jgi:hypothetical protein